MICRFGTNTSNGRHSIVEAFAIVKARNDHCITLCKVCFDAWLDNADDDPELEPKYIWFLTKDDEKVPA